VHRSAERRLSVAWLVVVAVTLIYLGVDGWVDNRGVPGASAVASVAAIGLALVKLRIIMREFMDVRHAPRMLRMLTDALVVAMGVCLLGTYVVAKSFA
jgi:cytochrome c oxidase subunit IV